MGIPQLALLGGVWLSLLYSAAVMPASVWAIQLTVSRGWPVAAGAAAGLAIGQFPWALAAAIGLLTAPAFWQGADFPARLLAVAFLLWMGARCLRAGAVQTLDSGDVPAGPALFRQALWRSFSMPWRLPLWAALILSVGAHLRGPGWEAALFFAVGTVFGQGLWLGHFIVVAALFGRRVPEPVSIHSINKLRLLAVVVHAGVALVIIAPVAFPPT
jgi:threonine/homoserine/homoserine lactone efflux protein